MLSKRRPGRVSFDLIVPGCYVLAIASRSVTRYAATPLKGHYLVWVSGNWRMIFAFDGTDVVLVDYLDYHSNRTHNDGAHVQPPHPGLTLRDDVLPALGLSVTEAAQQLGVTRVTLSRVLNGRAGPGQDRAAGHWC